MSERTVMAVVTDLLRSGLTVEQQILVNELALVVADAQLRADLDYRVYERERKRAYREGLSQNVPDCPGHVPDKRKEPKENNILNITPLGKVSETPLSGTPRSENTNPRALGTNARPSKGAWEPGFECFWNQYPRKKAKGAARKAYKNALTRATAAEIEAGARRYAASKPDPDFTKHPATWLNADCWLDEAEKVVSFRPGPAPRTWAEQKREGSAP
jgi:hypothetical protein